MDPREEHWDAYCSKVKRQLLLLTFSKTQYSYDWLIDDWRSLCKATPSDARNSQRFYYISAHVHTSFRLTKNFFDPKQLLQISCVWWDSLTKWSSSHNQNASLRCSFVMLHYILSRNNYSLIKGQICWNKINLNWSEVLNDVSQ